MTCSNHLTVVKNEGIQNTIPLPFEGASASFHDEKQQLALLGKDKKIHVYSYGEDGKLEEAHVTEEFFEVGDRIRYSPDGSRLAVTSGKNVLILNPADGFKEVESFSRASARIRHIEWSPDSTRLAAAGLDSHIHVYEFGESIEKIIINRAHPGTVILALQWVGNTIISAGYDSCVRIWEKQ